MIHRELRKDIATSLLDNVQAACKIKRSEVLDLITQEEICLNKHQRVTNHYMQQEVIVSSKRKIM